MPKIVWKIPKYGNVSASDVYDELFQGGNTVTPEQALQYAENHRDGALASCLEWDDAKAARKYRVSQCAEIIRLLVVQPDTPNKPTIRALSITTERNTYMPTQQVIRKENEYENLLKRALRELQAFQNRYSTLKGDLESLFEEIEKLSA